jgi:hypothetical protein
LNRIIQDLSHDHWHPAGYLLDKFGYRVVYDSGFSAEFKLSSIIQDGDSYWLSARSDVIVEIQSKLPEVVIGGASMPIWNSRSETYSCAET